MNEIKVSVIIPVYDTEDYLGKCLDSIAVQSLNDIEVIMINDGSTDGSLQILKKYAESDNRFIVIDKGNDGPGVCRNIGIRKARGKYIAFIDSDDYITTDGLRNLYETAVENNIDIIMAAHWLWKDKRSKHHESRRAEFYQIMSGTEFLKVRFTKNDFVHNTTCKIYKRDFLIKNNLFYIENVIHSDFYMSFRALLKVERLMTTDIDYYKVTERTGSMTRSADKTLNGISQVKICHELEHDAEGVKDRELQRLIYDHLASMYMYAIDFGNIYGRRYKSYYSKKFLRGKACLFKTRLKVYIFITNKWLYKYIKIFLGKTVKNRSGH